MAHVLDLLRGAAGSPHGLTFVAPQQPGRGAVASSSSGAAQAHSYADLLRCSRSLAAHLAAGEGTKKGDIVLIHAGTSHWAAFVSWWACQWLGALPCPLPLPHPDPSRQQAVISHLSALFDAPLVLAAADDMASWDECSLRVVSVDDFLCPSTLETHPQLRPPSIDAEDVAALMLTSGSTAMPKAVQLTHSNLLAAVRAKAAHLHTDGTSRYLNFIAPDHVANLSEIHLAAMLHGAAQVHVRSADVVARPPLLLELVDAFAISYTFAPNFLLAQLLAQVDGEQERGASSAIKPSLRTLRVFVSGGEAVPHHTAVRFNKLCVELGAASGPLVAGFGMTETGAGCIYRSAGTSQDNGLDNAPVGLAYPGLEVRLLAGDYLAAHDGLETGELILRGSSVTRGYLRNPEANAQAFTADGWFRTGDRARISPDGVVSLVGRSKEVLNINGVSIACADVQRGIEEARIDGVLSTFTVVCPYRPAGAATESYLVAFLPSDSANVLEPVLQVERAAWLAAGHAPLAVLPLDRRELGKSALGKISGARIAGAFAAGAYKKLEATLREAKRRRLSAETAEAKPRNAFEADMAAAVQQVLLLADPPSCAASFVELGCSSLALMRMRSAFARILGRTDSDLPVTQLLRHPSIRELAKSTALASDVSEAASVGPSGQPAAPFDPIVPLSTSGRGTPLFLIHPGVGECLVFLNLAKRFRDERPVFALRARGLGSEAKDVDGSGAPLAPSGSFAHFDDMCKTYAAAIMATQPRGPYAVVGYSFGGVVAFEVCKLLEAQGRDVKYAGLLNIPPHISWRMQQLDWNEIAVNLALFLGLVPSEDVEPLRRTIAEKRQLQPSASTLHPRDSAARSQPESARSRVVDLLRQAAPPARLEELGLDSRALLQWIDVAADLARSAQAYEPSGKLACAASVFVAVPLAGLGTREEWRRNHLDAWQAHVAGPLRFVDVEGAHYTMLDDEHVASFSARLRTELKLAGL